MENEKLPRNIKLRTRATKLRNEATREENRLWYEYLRKYPIHFYRQRIIDNYIVDFYCPQAKLVIELDGAQHFEEESMEYDSIRTEYLNSFGIAVLRFTNYDVHHYLEEVCRMIDDVVKKRTS